MGEDEIKDIKEKEIITEEIDKEEDNSLEDEEDSNVLDSIREKEVEDNIIEDMLVKKVEESGNLEDIEINIEVEIEEKLKLDEVEKLIQEKGIETIIEEVIQESVSEKNIVEIEEKLLGENIIKQEHFAFEEVKKENHKSMIRKIIKGITKFFVKITVFLLCSLIIFNVAYVYASKNLLIESIKQSISGTKSEEDGKPSISRLLNIQEQIKSQREKQFIRDEIKSATDNIE